MATRTATIHGRKVTVTIHEDDNMAHRKRGIYAIYDNVTKDVYGGLFLAANDNVAMRFMLDELRAQTNAAFQLLHQHPDDFSLIKIADLDVDATVTADRREIITGTHVMGTINNTPTKGGEHGSRR